MVAAILWAVVPRAIEQIDESVAGLPQTRSDLGAEARDSPRDRAEKLVCSLLPRSQRTKVHDTWNLIDAKLGA